MSALAPTLEAFFTERLFSQRRASPHTIAAYRDAFCLLLSFAQRETGKAPTKLELEDLDAPLIGAFLDSLERDRCNSVRTRNARMVTFLTDEEVEALVKAPDCTSFLGRRDHALLLLAIQTGLRVSELVGLKCEDVVLGTGAHVRCLGKGRKERTTPLTSKTAVVLKAWLNELDAEPAAPLFPTRQGIPLSRYGVTVLVARHAEAAAASCRSLAAKKVSPHVLRHTAAMRLLHAGVDTSVIALWLGHEGIQTTQIYVHADLSLKERALARTAPITSRPGRYRPPDQLLAFLQSL
jgi:integrase/recombinase XerD